MSAGRVFNQDEKVKLTQLINQGLSTLNEIETLTGGLNDTVKAIAEEMEIKPSVLKRAIKTAYKSTLTQTNEDHEELVTILESVGRAI